MITLTTPRRHADYLYAFLLNGSTWTTINGPGSFAAMGSSGYAVFLVMPLVTLPSIEGLTMAAKCLQVSQ